MSAKFPRGGGGAGPFLARSLTAEDPNTIIGVAPITQLTHVRNKNSNTQGSSPNVAYPKELLFNCRASLLDTEVSTFSAFLRSGYAIDH